MRWNSPSSIVHRRSSGVQRPASSVIVTILVANVVFVTAQTHTFEEVASGLKHKDAATRLRAIQIFKDADSAEAAVPIAAMLEDGDDRVQLAAIDAERSLFTTRPVLRRRKIGLVVEQRTISGGDLAEGELALKARAVPAQLLTGLAVALRDNNLRVRADAIDLTSLIAPYPCRGAAAPAQEACHHIGNALIDNINSRNALVRRGAMQALGHVRYASSVQALSDQLRYYQTGPDALAALEGLAGVGDSTSTSIFTELLTTGNADMRRLAVEGLARAGERDALTLLHQIGQSERSNGVLLALHYANSKLGGPGDSLRHLVAGLNNADQRPLALRYLLDLAPSRAKELTEFLGDQSPDLRRLVADIVGFSRDLMVITALDAATKDADPDVALAAGRAIERIKLK
jgi:HEAT repeat protein